MHESGPRLIKRSVTCLARGAHCAKNAPAPALGVFGYGPAKSGRSILARRLYPGPVGYGGAVTDEAQLGYPISQIMLSESRPSRARADADRRLYAGHKADFEKHPCTNCSQRQGCEIFCGSYRWWLKQGR